MPDRASLKIGWPKLGAEGLIIILSILLAFAVEEWRDERSDRELEREYLTRVLDDLETNGARLQRQRRSDQTKVANARAVYALVNRGQMGGLSEKSAVLHSYFATPSGTPTWINDTFEELKSTGRLSLIRSAEIRRELSAYYRFVEDEDWVYRLMSMTYRDSIRAKMDPDLQLQIREKCNLYDATKIDAVQYGFDADAENCTVDIADFDVEAYLAWFADNQELADGLRRVISQWTRAEQEYLPVVEQRTNQLQQLIETELER